MTLETNINNRRDSGFVIIAVLWMLAALSSLASIYAVYVIDLSVSMVSVERRLQAEALAMGAIELTAYRQLAVAPNLRATHGSFNFRLNGAGIEVAFVSEAGRIDLNVAPKPLLSGLFTVLGASRQDAEVFAEHIVRWRSSSGGGREGKRALNRSAGDPIIARNAPFPHTHELTLVPDLPPALVKALLPLVTVHSGRAQINVLEASPEVLAAVPGMTSERLAWLLDQRRLLSNTATALIDRMEGAKPGLTAEGCNVLRTTIHITFDDRRRADFVAVIVLFDQGDEPFSVLSWHDELDSGSAIASRSESRR